MKTNPEILKTFNCPEKAVKHGGVWMWPDELHIPRADDFIWNPCDGKIETATGYLVSPRIIFRPIPLPPKPTPEQLAKITPAGKVATLGEDVDDCSVPFVSYGLSTIMHDGEYRDTDCTHGLRWPVTLTNAPKEPVKPTDPRYIGLNPANVSMDVLKTMPEGARLLESEDESCAFCAIQDIKDDLFTHIITHWNRGWVGNDEAKTYCTTRPRGWWKVKAEPAVKAEPWLNVPDYPGSSNRIQRAIEQLQRAVDELRAK